MRKNARNRLTQPQLTQEERAALLEEIRLLTLQQTAGEQGLTEQQIRENRGIAAAQIRADYARQIRLEEREEERRRAEQTIQQQIVQQRNGLAARHERVPGRGQPPGELAGIHNLQQGDIVIYNERPGVRLEVHDGASVLHSHAVIRGFNNTYVRLRVPNGEIVNRAYRNVRLVQRPSEDEHNARWRRWGYTR